MRTILSQTEKNKSHPTDKHHMDNITLNQGKECLLQAIPTGILLLYYVPMHAINSH
jgi:hypothetical protein